MCQYKIVKAEKCKTDENSPACVKVNLFTVKGKMNGFRVFICVPEEQITHKCIAGALVCMPVRALSITPISDDCFNGDEIGSMVSCV